MSPASDCTVATAVGGTRWPRVLIQTYAKATQTDPMNTAAAPASAAGFEARASAPKMTITPARPMMSATAFRAVTRSEPSRQPKTRAITGDAGLQDRDEAGGHELRGPEHQGVVHAQQQQTGRGDVDERAPFNATPAHAEGGHRAEDRRGDRQPDPRKGERRNIAQADPDEEEGAAPQAGCQQPRERYAQRHAGDRDPIDSLRHLSKL